MRVYQNIHEAYSEITRDLAKSPVVDTKRVQNLTIDGTAREAMNYSYAIHDFPPPFNVEQWVELGVKMGLIPEDQLLQYLDWMRQEARSRLSWEASNHTELIHPALTQLDEGREPSYTYGDRLRGMVDVLSQTLKANPDSRRAYWPMFLPEDAIRATRYTRVPCTLGYQVSIRTVNGVPMLHMTYIERSCDFDTFWFTDLFMARYLQAWISLYVPPGIALGPLTHIVLSLHTFIDQEIY